MQNPTEKSAPDLSADEMRQAIHILFVEVAALLAQAESDETQTDEEAAVDAITYLASKLPVGHPTREWLERRAHEID